MTTGHNPRSATSLDTPCPVVRAVIELWKRASMAPAVAPAEILRLEREIEPVDVLAWLRSAPAGERRYFRDRSRVLEVAGVGIARSGAFGSHELARLAPGSTEASSEPIHFTALPFDPDRARDPEWVPFLESACVLPVVELRRQGERHTVAVHVAGDAGPHGGADDARARTARVVESLASASQACVVEPALVRESDGGGEAEWTRIVRGALERIRDGSLRKIVLARTRRYAASGTLDPVSVLARLASREARGFRFLVEARPGSAFLGVTPERLVSRTGRVARSEAVAGTRPRGVDRVADHHLGESLLASAKDRREHELVVERVREAFAPRATSLRLDPEPRLQRLAYVQHLVTRVGAHLRPGVTDLDLVRALHPTPAVAGAPVADATQALRAFEPFDRGLYAGPVGVVSREGAEIAVAIRSARIDGDALTAYAGAGIVEGSDPAEEWRETGHKLLGFERLAT